jgi:hypothetical protein
MLIAKPLDSEWRYLRTLFCELKESAHSALHPMTAARFPWTRAGNLAANPKQ